MLICSALLKKVRRMPVWQCVSLLIFALALPGMRANAQNTLHPPPAAYLRKQAAALYKRLTLADKLKLLTGTGFTSVPLPQAGLPALGMVDGAQGVRGGTGSTQGPATAFPAGVCLASTWDLPLVQQVGRIIGIEALNKGTGAQILLAPAINIQRSPLDGRNGEFFSEDPFLTAQLAVSYINGVQSTGCIACVKHYVCNNEELDRGYVNVNVGERALREIYLPGFRAAVKKAHVWSIMAAYNRVNGQYCTDNWYLLTDVLRDDWGFRGLAMSDWGAVHDTAGPPQAGLDLEMPGPGFLRASNLKAALNAGEITTAQIDRAVKRLLYTVVLSSDMQHFATPNHALVNTAAARKLAFQAAAEGMVLLKNSRHILPLRPGTVHSIAIIGPRAQNWHVGAEGSVGVQPPFYINPYQAIVKRAGSKIAVTYVQGTSPGPHLQAVPSTAFQLSSALGSRPGLRAAYYPGRNFRAATAEVRTEPNVYIDYAPSWERPSHLPPGRFCVRYQGVIKAPATGRYLFMLSASGGYRLYINHHLVLQRWLNTYGSLQGGAIRLQKGTACQFQLDFRNSSSAGYLHLSWIPPARPHQFAAAVAAAQKSDVAIVFAGSSDEAEGTDRPSMDLQGDQGALIKAVAAANPHTIVVLNNGTPVRMVNWLGSVQGVVEGWFPGEEGAPALAGMLFGDIDPSGKLPDTIGASVRDYPDFGNFPGVNGQVYYKEGIYVGYRWFDKKQIAPLFPFGYGLSYTTFRFSHLRLSHSVLSPKGAVQVQVDVSNTGSRSGAEVVQLYVQDPHPKVDRAVRELKGFVRLQLKPGQTGTARFTLNARDFAFCNVQRKQWEAYAGRYLVEAAASSRDIRETVPLRLTQTWVHAIPGIGKRDPYLPKPSLATGKPTAASSVKHGNLARYATDGDPSTRWESQWADPQWIAVDLQKAQSVQRVTLNWETACAKAFRIDVSLDGIHWKTVYSTNNGKGGLETLTFPAVKARWVRMYGMQRATQYGYSLWSMDVYGTSGKQ